MGQKKKRHNKEKQERKKKSIPEKSIPVGTADDLDAMPPYTDDNYNQLHSGYCDEL